MMRAAACLLGDKARRMIRHESLELQSRQLLA
jgi:hypothetical protein